MYIIVRHMLIHVCKDRLTLWENKHCDTITRNRPIKLDNIIEKTTAI